MPKLQLFLDCFVFSLFCLFQGAPLFFCQHDPTSNLVGCCPHAVMRATVPIPALASASVLHSAAVGGSVVGVVGPL